MLPMVIDPDICYRAFASRDRRFDGRFVSAVLTTKIYCRPSCPARSPARRNVRFYPHPAAAEAAGFRPCLRCRPDAAPGSGAWAGTSATVARALRLIDSGALDDAGVEAIADRLGVTSRWLRQLFAEQLGASPLMVARTRRVHFARRLLDETELPLVDIAIASGFGSARRLHDAVRATFHRAPGELRRTRSARRSVRAGGAPAAFANGWPTATTMTAGRTSPSNGRVLHPSLDNLRDGVIELRLPARAPFDAGALMRFFAARAISGVEHVADDTYSRSVVVDGALGMLEARAIPGDTALALSVRLASPRGLMPLVANVKRMFDLDTDAAEIARHLRRDPLLRHFVPTTGVRVPGAWDPFEIGVRALLGQQISVAAARTLAARLVQMCGEPLDAMARGSITHAFPAPAAVASADVARIGLPRTRAAALRGFAAAVADGTIDLSTSRDLDEIVRALTALPGIGPWSAHYMAMRAYAEPDAFPASDLGVLKALGRRGTIATARGALARAEAWRPWRAYAVIALWTSDSNAADEPSRPTRKTHRKERS